MDNKSKDRNGMTPFLQMRGVSKSYSGVRVLHHVNLSVDTGEVLALVGENGAGKSTLIKTLAGAISSDEGEILIQGKKVEFQTPLDAETNGIATVYQELNLFPYLTVTENLFFSSFHRRKGPIPWKKLHQEAQDFLVTLGLHLRAERLVSTLSIAEKQMLEIAKALHVQARVLILDEPTAVLGGHDVDRLLEIVKQLKERGVAVIFISHRLNEIFGLADTYLVLKDGHQVASGRISETNHDDLVGKMVGRHIAHAPERVVQHDKRRELLRVEGLSRKGVLQDINLSLFQGEVLGIAGLRGAGRTELVRAIFGADPIDAGKVFIQGREIKVSAPRKAVAHRMGLVPEDRGTQGLFKNLSAQQNIFMAKPKPTWIDYRKERQTAEGHVASLQIKLPTLNVLVGGLSGGNQQKIVIAKWLEAGIDIFLLDEPTRGIDIGAKAQIYSVMRDLCQKGMGVILISSELPEILENSHRVMVMYKGRIAGELKREDATEEEIMKYAVGGESS
ncbi:MAG TPA: sugar ABC transporter ATP-binding protein [Chthoniobacterales bacterium]